MTKKTLIRGGRIIDGTGTPAFAGDLLVADGLIAAMGSAGSFDGVDAENISAQNAFVVPGFIDVHSHADNAPMVEPTDVSKVLQGVTTEVVGNCGFTLARTTDEFLEDMEGLLGRIFPQLDLTWSDFAGLHAQLDMLGYVTNHATLVGHNTVRVSAMGMSAEPADASQMRLMVDQVKAAAAQGVVGLSSGLIYPPGQFAPQSELVELVQALPDHLPYVTHMRGEGTMLLRSLDEAIAIGRDAGRPVHISHLKAAGRQAWGSIARALDLIDAANSDGMRVSHDIYPYTASSTMLTATLPPWFQEGGNGGVLRRLSDRRALDRARSELAMDTDTWENHVYGCGWDRIVIASTRSHAFEGSSLQAISDDLGLDPFDALTHVLRAEELEASMIMHSMHEDDVIAALKHPGTMIGSDGLPPGRGGKPHPRMWGTFPRVLDRYVAKLGILTLEEAIRRMTSLPAQTFALRDRGVIRETAVADLVLIETDGVADRATFDDPCSPPRGVRTVVLGGETVVSDGSFTSVRAGRRIQAGASTSSAKSG